MGYKVGDRGLFKTKNQKEERPGRVVTVDGDELVIQFDAASENLKLWPEGTPGLDWDYAKDYKPEKVKELANPGIHPNPYQTAIPVADIEEDTEEEEVKAEAEELNATEAAVKEAVKLDVDVAEVKGTGKGGKVTKPDVDKAAEEQK